jgi:hypothetical protein
MIENDGPQFGRATCPDSFKGADACSIFPFIVIEFVGIREGIGIGVHAFFFFFFFFFSSPAADTVPGSTTCACERVTNLCIGSCRERYLSSLGSAPILRVVMCTGTQCL